MSMFTEDFENGIYHFARELYKIYDDVKSSEYIYKDQLDVLEEVISLAKEHLLTFTAAGEYLSRY